MPILIQSVTLRNFLSFGDEAQTIELGPLNVLVGPNGSGKSNFLEVFDVLRTTPGNLDQTITIGGGAREWIYKNNQKRNFADLRIKVNYFWHNYSENPIYYNISFSEYNGRFSILDEKIEYISKGSKNNAPRKFEFEFTGFMPEANITNGSEKFTIDNYDEYKTVLNQIRDPNRYPTINYLSHNFSEIKIYREWIFGRHSPLRRVQSSDAPNKHLAVDASNIGLVFNFLRNTPATKRQIIKYLAKLYDGIDDFYEQIEGGTVQLFLTQGDHNIPAVRLSDGTLRYLCLLTILLHPNPPPLICIEEPELGLHPDIIPVLAELLKDAATRTQVVVTTHSDILISALSDQPEAILICERDEHGTKLKRLDAKELAPWLEKYRLGDLWIQGQIGGTRW